MDWIAGQGGQDRERPRPPRPRLRRRLRPFHPRQGGGRRCLRRVGGDQRSRQGLGALLRDVRRGDPDRHVRHLRPPGPREGLGRGASATAPRPALSLRAADRGDRGDRGRRRGVHGGPRESRSASSIPRTRSPRCAWMQGRRSRSRRTRTSPSTSATDTSGPSRRCGGWGVTELCVFEGRERRLEEIG